MWTMKCHVRGKQLVFCSPTDVRLDRRRWHQTKFFQKSVSACCAAIRLLFCGKQIGTSGDGLLWGAACNRIMLWKWKEGEEGIALEDGAVMNGSAVSFLSTLVSLLMIHNSRCRPLLLAHFHFCLCRFQLALVKWVICMPCSVCPPPPPPRPVFFSECSANGHKNQLIYCILTALVCAKYAPSKNAK